MIWQRKVRFVLGLAGLGAAVAVFLMARERPVAPPVSIQPTDRSVVAEGGATVTSRTTGSFEDARWSFEAFKDYEDGSSWYSNVHVLFEADGVEVWADEVLRHAAPAGSESPRELDLSGHVRFRTDDGLELTTPRATYSEATGIITMPDAVAFSKERLTGTGRGATYDRNQELFRMREDTTLDVEPDEAGAFIHATSISMTLARDEGFARLETNARIVRVEEVLAGDIATIYFVEETDELRLVDLRGRASVTPARDAANPPPEMRADTISLTFHPERRTLAQATLVGSGSLVSATPSGPRSIVAPWMDIRTAADGHTVTGLTARDGVTVRLPAGDATPARTIEAPALVASGNDEAGLTEARFSGNVVFTEQANERDGRRERVGRSRALQLSLDGSLDAITDAEFIQQVRFESGETTAEAERAVYTQADDRLLLRSDPGRPGRPHVEDGRVTIDADDITLGLSGDRVEAEGDVRTRSEPDAEGGGPRRSGLFESGETVIGRAPVVVYDGDPAHVVYRGSADEPARLLQNDSRLEALVIEIDDETGNLSAAGAVVSSLVLAAEDGDPDADPVPYEIQADVLDYDDAARQATYRGEPVRMASGEGRTEAETVVLTLAEASRQVDRVEWTGTVYALFDEHYEALGDQLQYEAATGRYLLRGQPAVTKFPSEDGSECVRQTGLLTEFNRRTGEGSWPPEHNRRVSNQGMSCRTSIR